MEEMRFLVDSEGNSIASSWDLLLLHLLSRCL
ncbi:Uncharacterised protein [Yersinia frederiksenii]|nr:Uncharacterised protein [Yersinia frederiksenii]CNH30671.1 Uncharacterised protein [Yersinia frederiksenii]CNH68993.1 Uncharacterised protein [Yersinia frederiksenii]CNI38385.1 Uncharacterised protein [Yersinia frederiksenii]